MATWELNTKGISGIAEARELPGLAAKTLVSYCPRCTGSPRWPSAGYLVPTRAPWMRPTCQATSTSSSSGSIVVTPEAEGCFSTVFWNLRSSMHLFDTRTSSPPSVHGQCHLSLHIDEGTHPAWRCLPRTARGGGKPTPVKWRAQRSVIGAELRAVWNAKDMDAANTELRLLVQRYAKTAPALSQWLERNVPEGLAVFSLPEHHRLKMRTSNPIERTVQQEIKRRTVKVRVFPSTDALLRLVSAVLVEIDEKWAASTQPYITWKANTVPTP